MHAIKFLMNRSPLLLLLIAVFAFAGCDSDNGMTGDASVTFEGRVTDEAGFGKQAAAVEGAAVTAVNLEADGSLTTLAGEAATNADGRFSLAVEGAAEMVVLTAQKDTFRSEVLVLHEGNGTVRAMPMTTESEAEAAVYVESARRGIAGDVVTAADVAASVNQRLAAEWDAGRTTAAEVAAALEASAQAEAEYFAEESADVDLDEVRRNDRRALLTVQADLGVATGPADQDAAIAAFEQALVEAYTEAGASLEIQAEARQASRAALLKFYSPSGAEARFALRQQAEIVTALVTAQAIEAAFEADGASQERLDALAQAQSTLLTALRAASSDAEIDAAQDAYAAGVEAEIMAELNIDAALLATLETVLTTTKAALDASVAAAASAGDVAEAYAVFHATAQAEAETTLAASSNADLGAHVLTLLNTP